MPVAIPPVEIRFYNADGSERRQLSPNAVQPGARWKRSRYGGYAEASFTLSGTPDELGAVREYDRVRVYVRGDLRYSGFVTQTGRTTGDPHTLRVTCQGKFAQIAAVSIDGRYIAPTALDISQAFASFANVEGKAAFPDLYVEIATSELGVNVQVEDAFNKSLGDVFASMAERIGGLAVYGCDEYPGGLGDLPTDRLYLRPIGSRTDPDWTVPVPGPWNGAGVSAGDGGPDASRLANVLTLTGSGNKYPNLLGEACRGNVGFERPILPGPDVTNVFADSSYEHPVLTLWDLYGGASLKSGSLSEGPTRSGANMVEIDDVGEGVRRAVSFVGGMTPGDVFIVGTYARLEVGGGTDDASFKIRVQFKNGGSDVGSALEETFALTDARWEGEGKPHSIPVTVPSGLGGVTGFETEFELVSKAGSRGIVLDDSFAYNARLLQDGWTSAVNGSPAKFNVLQWVNYTNPRQGRYSVAADVTANDADNQDCYIGVRGRFAVEGNTSLRAAVYAKAWAGASVGKLRLEVWFFKSDGGDAGITRVDFPAGTVTDAGWTQLVTDAISVPGGAVAGYFRITFRGNAQVYLDDPMVRDAAIPQTSSSPDEYEWVDDGPYRVTLDVTSTELSGLTTDQQDSITRYGRRYARVQSDAVYDRASALVFAARYFQVYALPLARPVLTIEDCPVTILPGQTVRVAGAVGRWLSDEAGGDGGAGIPVAEVEEIADAAGRVTTQVSLELEQPDERRITAEIVRRMRQSTTGGGVASFAFGAAGGGSTSGGGGSGSGTTLTVKEADGSPTVTPATTIQFPNGSLTDLGGGAVGVAFPSGSGSGTVTSVDADGGTTGLDFTGGPVTGAGTLTLDGTLVVAHGGTGATTAAGARTNLGAAAQTDVTALTTEVVDARTRFTNSPFASFTFGSVASHLDAVWQQVAGLVTELTNARTRLAISPFASNVYASLKAHMDGVWTAIANLYNRTVTAGTGLTGGGDLSADRTISIAAGGVGTTQLANSAVTVAKVSATGTPDSSTFLRGDGAWAVPPSASGLVVTGSPSDGDVPVWDDLAGEAVWGSVAGGAVGELLLNASTTIVSGSPGAGETQIATNEPLLIRAAFTADGFIDFANGLPDGKVVYVSHEAFDGSYRGYAVELRNVLTNQSASPTTGKVLLTHYGDGVTLVADSNGYARVVALHRVHRQPRGLSSATTLTSRDFGRAILADAAAGAFTVTLPAPAAEWNGQTITVKRTNTGANAVTISRNGTETIDGANTLSLSAQYQARTLLCDGTNWHVISQV